MNLGLRLVYILAAGLFIVGLKMLSRPEQARRGNLLSAVGMWLGIVATLFDHEIVDYRWIATGILLGSVIGAWMAIAVKMTSMPGMVALLNGFGGLASLLVGWEVHHDTASLSAFLAITIFLAVVIGGVTFTGSLVAWAKLEEKISGKPMLFSGQQIVNALVLLTILGAGACYAALGADLTQTSFAVFAVLSLLLGVLAIIPIGGADMPVAVSLLNSYSGLAACASGFVLRNDLLIVAGSLVGTSGLILTQIMCKAMNRSLGNVLFSGFGAAPSGKAVSGTKGEAKPISIDDAYLVLEAARSVVIVPGYGLAVAQAQHSVRELAERLEGNGCDVRFAIHPVAGRMPGHMNVLLAEANVPYEQLAEMTDVNPMMESVDVVLVIGANDVVNPAAREDKTSPIYGMPVIEVDRAKTVFVVKRSMASGFAGIDNPLFFKPNCRMLFGDAKQVVQNLVAAFKKG